MWTEITRRQYDRKGRRYASDATDDEWSHIEPLLPPAKPGGRPRTSAKFWAILRTTHTELVTHLRGASPSLTQP